MIKWQTSSATLLTPVPLIVARGTVVVESRVTLAVITAASNPVREKRMSAAAAVTPDIVTGTGSIQCFQATAFFSTRMPRMVRRFW